VEGYAAGWTGWWEGIEALLLLTVRPFSPQVAVGWGDLAVLQVVADLSPPSCTPRWLGGGDKGVYCQQDCYTPRATTYRYAGWLGTERLAGNSEGWLETEGWLGTEKVGWGLRRLAGDWEGWLGTEKVAWGLRRLARD